VELTLPPDKESSFGSLAFDPLNACLRKGKKVVHLPPLVCEILRILVEREGNVVSKQDLEDLAWGEGNEQNSLRFQIWQLRKALGEYGLIYRQYIQTKPKKGYRLVGKLEVADGGTKEGEREAESNKLRDRATKKSLAVIPFAAMTEGEPDEDLADGMTTAVTAKLSDINQIVVTPLRTIRRFADQLQNSLALGRKLEVDAIVEGSVKRVGKRLMGTVRLIRVKSNRELWVESFDVHFNDIFKLHTLISLKLAEQLVQELTHEEKVLLAKQQTDNPEAYSLYVKGRKQWNLRTDEGLENAIQYFKQAIDVDPNYAVAFAGLADSYNLRSYYCGVKPIDTFPQALSYAEKALNIDARLPEAHTSRAYSISRCYWKWDEAEDEYKQAILLRPNYATAHQWYAEFLTAMGRFAEAIAQIKHAMALDRHSSIINATFGTVLYFSRRFDEAIKQYRRTIKKDPDFVRTHFRLARALAQKGKFIEAISECEKGIQLSRDKTREIVQLAQVYAIAGRNIQALRIVNDLQELAKDQYVSEYNVAIVYANLGDDLQAFNMLEKASWSRDPWLEHLNIDPRLDRIRSNVRFKDLLQRVDLA
jgi:TolB-like protein/Tfp pilus assembly protein PilF